MNMAILIGNLGKDVEIKTTSNDNTMALFSLATTKFYKGEKHTEWHNIVCFGKLAEIAGNNLSKGSKISLVGQIQYDKYQDKDGNNRVSTKIIGRDIEFLTPKNQQQAPSQEQPSSPKNGRLDDEYPF